MMDKLIIDKQTTNLTKISVIMDVFNDMKCINISIIIKYKSGTLYTYTFSLQAD